MGAALLASGLDWVTVASLATAAGTLVLALATFSSVRSANRTARAAERSLQAGTQPVLMPSRPTDPSEKIMFVDEHWVKLAGGRASAEATDDAIYLTMALHNVGPGLGIIQAWDIRPEQVIGDQSHHDPEQFRRQTRDLYVPAGDFGFWQGALRDESEPVYAPTRALIERGDPITIDLLYCDSAGGQRTITRFRLVRGEAAADNEWFPSVNKHWHLDGPSPR